MHSSHQTWGETEIKHRIIFEVKCSETGQDTNPIVE